MKEQKTFLSDRGIPLIMGPLAKVNPNLPTLTVEAYIKWYSLFLVHPDGSVETVPFPESMFRDTPALSPYIDHVPNPVCVLLYAMTMQYDVDDLALELMIGRWVVDAGRTIDPIEIEQLLEDL